MRLVPYWYTIEHIAGRANNQTADMLSRSPVASTQRDRDIVDEDLEDRIVVVVAPVKNSEKGWPTFYDRVVIKVGAKLGFAG